MSRLIEKVISILKTDLDPYLDPITKPVGRVLAPVLWVPRQAVALSRRAAAFVWRHKVRIAKGALTVFLFLAVVHGVATFVLGRKVDELPVEIRDKLSDEEKGKTYATVVYRYVDSKAVTTPIKIAESDLTRTIILSGITEEDKVVVGPYKVLENLKHDQKVTDEREAKEKKKGTKAKTDSNDVNDVSND